MPMSRLACALIAALGAASSHSAPGDRFEAEFERLETDGISVEQATFRQSFELGTWSLDAALGARWTRIDYQPVPFDFRGAVRRRTDRGTSLRLSGQRAFGDSFWLLAGAGFTTGFDSYRSLWLAEYYRQQFSDLPGVSGAELYKEVDPKGSELSLGGRWMYQPSSGFLQLVVSQLQDEVSPGYEIDFDGLRRGELTLATSAVRLTNENVLTKRIRTLMTVRASKTTARSTRIGADFALNYALGEKWIWASQASWTKEAPRFQSRSISTRLEYAITDTLSLLAEAGRYSDSGEIENALLFTAAAPGLESRRAGFGARWIGQNWSGKLFWAPFQVDYELTQLNADFFQNLYRDRDWDALQIVIGRRY